MLPDLNEELRLNVLEAIRNTAPLRHSEIIVSVINCIVILSGSVENHDHKDIAAAVAKSVSGVKAIVQKLAVQVSPEKINTEQICLLIRESFSKNPEIPGDRIAIHNESQQIALVGTVRWNYQKSAALRLASIVAGMIPVVDQIVVDNALTEDFTRESILKVLLEDRRVICDDISIIVNGRNVILAGSIPLAEQRALTQRIVEAIPGVGSVNNALHVKG